MTIHQGSYSAYIMASRSHTLYIGVTGNLHKRVFEHKWKEHEGFTARYNCDRLVWFENYQDVTKAIDREKQLKGWRREKKIALIEKTNPAGDCSRSPGGIPIRRLMKLFGSSPIHDARPNRLPTSTGFASAIGSGRRRR